MINKKRAQVTLFIIIAVVIIGAAILFFAFTDIGREIISPIVPSGIGTGLNVEKDFEKCVLDDEMFNKEIAAILKQGGDNNPEHFFLYNDTKYKYLCYSANYYEACINQEPLLIQSVEAEILDAVKPILAKCIQKIEKNLMDRGFEIRSDDFNSEVDIITGNINIKILYNLRIKKGDVSKVFESFEIKKKSEAYQLITVASSIINFEAHYGDSDSVAYMSIYPNTRVEKLKQDDGTTVYRLSDRVTKEEFNFATRSYALPPGYLL